MPRRESFATAFLTLVVVSGLLLMHGFEAASPEPLASHAQHDVALHDVERVEVAAAVGLCVFVLVVIAAVGLSLASEDRVVFRRPRGWERPKTAVWRPLLPSSYELCVMRV
ncbi:MAG: hypothetical protein ACLGHX_13930 [Acidimicrobiia bacterium]